MTRAYEAYKSKYEKTKPIRGRSPEVRPIGERRRTWEEVVRVGDNYAARLYDTDVVEYLPSGDVIVRTNGWHTPSTAEFIHEHSPFSCWKQGNKLWIRARNKDGDGKVYPIGNELHMKHIGGSVYEPATPVVIQKKVVDRVKAKEVRATLQPFLQWSKTFLTLSDGWVMHETCKAALNWKAEPVPGYDYVRDEQTIYRMLMEPQADIEPEHCHLQVLCMLAHNVGHVEKRVVESHPSYYHDGKPAPYQRHFHDVRIDYAMMRDMVYRWTRKYGDVDKIVEVEPTNKAIYRTA